MEKSIKFERSKPDTRVWMFQVLIVTLLSFQLGGGIEAIILFFMLDILMIMLKMTRIAIKFMIFYWVIYLFNTLISYFNIPVISMMFSIICILCLQMMPVYLACKILIDKTPMNELIAVLENIHVSKMFIIPIASLYRYMPTIKKEIQYVRESMIMRGLDISLIGFIKNPIQYVERFMVPILIRSGKLADELAASSLCKGLDSEHRRTCIVEVKFRLVDFLFCILILIVAVALVCKSRGLL